MAQYIDKAAVIAEMKRRIFNLEQLGDRKFIETHFNEQFRFIKVYEGIIDFVNTLEVKEVDLENLREELDRVVKIYNPNGDFGWGTLYNIALHFFELGIKVNQKGE